MTYFVNTLEDDIQTFSKDNLPEGNWLPHRKTTVTYMVRIDGPFRIETSEGPLTCQDGWVAKDARGYPYPLDAKEKELIYEEIREVPYA